MGKLVDGAVAGVEDFFTGIPHSETTHKQMQPPALKPQNVTHVVRRGETLSSIAGHYPNVTYQEIAQTNGMANPNNIYVGQRLTIPNQPHVPRTPKAPKPKPHIKPVPDATSTGRQDNKAGCKCKPPKWMRIAKKEIGTKEIHGKKHNLRVLEYHSVSGGFSTDEVPWCGSFINWVMKQAGYKTVSFPARAKSWKNFGKKAQKPIYGAIAVKSRKGGGHVALVVGQSKDGKYLYVLGGNQHDAVNISKYRRSVWTDFRVPLDYDDSRCTLPVYGGSASKGGKES